MDLISRNHGAEGVDEVRKSGAARTFEPRRDFISEDYVAGESGRIYLFRRDWVSGIEHQVTVAHHRP